MFYLILTDCMLFNIKKGVIWEDLGQPANIYSCNHEIGLYRIFLPRFQDFLQTSRIHTHHLQPHQLAALLELIYVLQLRC